jgi:hypothetical protein
MGVVVFPRKVFGALRLIQGLPFTLDNLRKRQVIVINICCMCKKTGEFMNHLLLHCDVGFALWSSLFSCFGMSWVMPRRVIYLFAGGQSSGRPRSVVENDAYLSLLVLMGRKKQ